MACLVYLPKQLQIYSYYKFQGEDGDSQSRLITNKNKKIKNPSLLFIYMAQN